MTLNIQKFEQIVSGAKAKAANDPKWLRAIEKASAAILSGEMIVTTLAHGALVTTTGGSYLANGNCPCPARTKHCYHRAGARLWALYEEMATPAVTLAAETADVYCSCCGAPAPQEWDTCPSCGTEGEWMTEDEFFGDEVAESSRENLIAEIKNIWPRFAPGLPLAVELMARFRVNELEMLDDGCLRAIRLAIAI